MQLSVADEPKGPGLREEGIADAVTDHRPLVAWPERPAVATGARGDDPADQEPREEQAEEPQDAAHRQDRPGVACPLRAFASASLSCARFGAFGFTFSSFSRAADASSNFRRSNPATTTML